MNMKNKSHLTAIKRKKLSDPMKFLWDNMVIKSGMLDYGCGRGDDAATLSSLCKNEFICHKYDPHYSPTVPTGKFDVITCHFVLNVVGEKEGKTILKNIQKLLTPNGSAYITVRRDVKKEGYTSKGTYQRNVILDLPWLYEKKGRYCIYRMLSDSTIK